MLFVTVWAYVPVQSVSAAEAQSADSAGVYVFQDAKKEGTVTVIKNGKMVELMMKDLFQI